MYKWMQANSGNGCCYHHSSGCWPLARVDASEESADVGDAIASATMLLLRPFHCSLQ